MHRRRRTHVRITGYRRAIVAFQASLFGVGVAPAPRPIGAGATRAALADGAWFELHRGWYAGGDELFGRLVEAVPWRAERRPMYERVVEVPRLLYFYDDGDPLPVPELGRAREALDAHFGPELGEPLCTVGLCLYRDGRDSVAWHGDRIGRGGRSDTIVAILSLGAPRTLALRPRGGGRSIRFELGGGDLFVMGGSCQRTWEHAVPKTARQVGPRLSVQFRTRGVR